MTASKQIVICGAGIAGVAAAYFLAVRHGRDNVVLVEADNPLSLTSDKSTEAYRNWWPGPDRAMTEFMNRSIDLIEGLARDGGNRINLNRRGYLFATAEREKIPWLKKMSHLAQQHGAGELRLHAEDQSDYSPVPPANFDDPLAGVDLITNDRLIRRHFPYLSDTTVAVAHARRAGSLSAQQLGMTMLEAARESGVQLMRGSVVAVHADNNQVSAVDVDMKDGGRQTVPAQAFVLTAGPMLKPMAQMIGLELPVIAERHQKISLPDSKAVIPRDAPMLIWLDEQFLPWSDDERVALADDGSVNWLLEQFPAGVHCRPEGGGNSQTLLALYNYENLAEDVVFPLRDDPHYAEIVLRGLSTMIPGLSASIESGIRPYVDGGYYIRTKENRPLIGPLPLGGAYVSGAYSGFGIMASCAGGDLVARHIVGAPLPEYAPAFTLTRYADPDYQAMLDDWGDDGQL